MVALTAPAGLGGAAFQSADIDPTPFVRREPGGIARLELAVKGARCAACIQRIEEGLGTMPGVTSARLNLSTAKLSVTWREGALAPAAIVERVQSLGYEAAPYDPQALLANEDGGAVPSALPRRRGVRRGERHAAVGFGVGGP